MGTTRRPRDLAGDISVDAFDWFRRFLVELNGYVLVEGQKLGADADLTSYRRAAIRAVIVTLRDSGADMETIRAELANALFDCGAPTTQPEWTAEMNQRRFELIDGEIQGRLSPTEQLELESLTQAMRRQVDNENVMPFSGAQALHRRLLGQTPASTDSAE